MSDDKEQSKPAEGPNWASIPLPGSAKWPEEITAWRRNQPHKVSQNDLARFLGQAPAKIAGWERGEPPTDAQVELLKAVKAGGLEAIEDLVKRRRRAAHRSTPPDWASVPLPGHAGWGERLGEWRTRMGLQQSQLGEVLGESRDTVAGWEVGRASPTSEQQELFKALKSGGPDAVKTRAVEVALMQVAERFNFGKGASQNQQFIQAVKDADPCAIDQSIVDSALRKLEMLSAQKQSMRKRNKI